MSNIMQKYGWVIPNISFHDETFSEAFPALVDNLHHDRDVCIEREHPADINSYLGFKQELETLLTTRDMDEIEEVMVKSENRRIPYPNDDRIRQKIAIHDFQFLERIYHEIYKDDPEYKPELVQTPIEELLKMHF